MNPNRLFAVGSVLLSLSSLAIAGPAITVRDKKDGKVLLVVDDETVRAAPGATPVLFIDGNNISKTKGGKPLFVMPGDILYAYKYDGEVVQYLDGRQMRDKPGGKETLNVHGQDIREPNINGKEVYWVDDNQVMNPRQLMAAIYTLRPELFVVPPEPAGASAAATPAAAFAGGTYTIDSYTSSDNSRRNGKVVIAQQGDVWALSLSISGGDPLQGVATLHNGELYAAIGPAGTMGLAVYQIDGGTLTGTWLNVTGDKNSFGSETASGAATLGGTYNITAGKAPFTGAAYTGTLNAEAVSGAMLGDAPVYRLAWDLGGYKAAGVGFKTGPMLLAASSASPDFAIVRFKIDPATSALTGDFYTVANVKGVYKLTRDAN